MDFKIVDDMLASINIVDVIGHYIPLKKAGSNYKALCPFHDEKTPSFNVSDRKQIYKCFGCGASGNAVSFVRDYEKLNFWEAVQKVAELTGYVLPEVKKNTQKNSRIDLLYKVYKLSKKFYRENLIKHGSQVLSYLEKRGISQQTQEKFEFGYALNSFNGLQNYLLKNFINRDILKESGLFASNERGIYDLFRDRLMIPIHTSAGRAVAFGGRKMSPDQPGGKYINSPTTPIYNKSRELYGLNVTKYDIGKDKDYVLVSEGYLDMLRLYEHGFTNSVASLGTALTAQQISLLGRYTQNVYIIYDGDAPGRKAALRAAGEVVKRGMAAKIVLLPENEDPDSYLKKRNAQDLQKLIDSALKFCEYVKQENMLEMNKREKLQYVVGLAGEIENKIEQELFLNEAGEAFDVTVNSLLSEIKVHQLKKMSIPQPKKDKFEEEKFFLKKLLDEPEVIKRISEQIDSSFLLDDNYRQIYEILLQHQENLQQVSSLEMSVSPQVWTKISDILLLPDSQTEIDEYILDIKLRRLRSDLKKITKKMKENELSEDLLNQYRKLKEKIRLLSGDETVKLIYN